MSLILACGQTDPGLARLHNEDAFRVDSDYGLYVVADGMGGHSHGEVASKIAVETIAKTLRAPEPMRAVPPPISRGAARPTKPHRCRI